MDESTARAFGRVESSLDRIDARQVEILTNLARHDERLRIVEGRVDDLENARTDDQRQGLNLRQALGAGLVLALVNFGGSALISYLVP